MEARSQLEEIGIDSDDSDLGLNQGEQVQERLANDVSKPNMFQPGINNKKCTPKQPSVTSKFNLIYKLCQ